MKSKKEKKKKGSKVSSRTWCVFSTFSHFLYFKTYIHSWCGRFCMFDRRKIWDVGDFIYLVGEGRTKCLGRRLPLNAGELTALNIFLITIKSASKEGEPWKQPWQHKQIIFRTWKTRIFGSCCIFTGPSLGKCQEILWRFAFFGIAIAMIKNMILLTVRNQRWWKMSFWQLEISVVIMEMRY